jgi:hypothetical protein
MGVQEGLCARASPSLEETSLLGELTAACPIRISTSSSVRSLGAGLVMARADSDHGWEPNVSGEAAF